MRAILNRLYVDCSAVKIIRMPANIAIKCSAMIHSKQIAKYSTTTTLIFHKLFCVYIGTTIYCNYCMIMQIFIVYDTITFLS